MLQIQRKSKPTIKIKCFKTVESIFAGCSSNFKKFPTPRGTKRKAIIKYGFGGILLTGIILIIWFPLLLFSFSAGFNRTVPPSTCRFDVQLAEFIPIYSMTSQQRMAQVFTQENFDNLKKHAPQVSFSLLVPVFCGPF